MKIQVVVGDITRIPADAIVNAANPALVRGGGVCGSIFKAAGPELDKYLSAVHPMGCHTGEVVLSPGFDLPVNFIIHAVGPDMRTQVGNLHGASLLATVYWNALDAAAKVGASSVAFPAISTGIYGFPADAAADIAVDTAYRWLTINDYSVKRVMLVAYNDEAAEPLRNSVERLTSSP